MLRSLSMPKMMVARKSNSIWSLP